MDSSKKDILLVEDDQEIRDLLVAHLSRQGYRVDIAIDGPSALNKDPKKYDLFLLDVTIPPPDGLEVLKSIRNTSLAPVIILSARGDEVDRVIGLELGADDYVTKPFGLREISARVKAHLRRHSFMDKQAKDKHLSAKGLSFDNDNRRAFLHEGELSLSPTEYELLRVLASFQGQTLSREDLVEKVWGQEYLGDTRRVDLYVSRIRQKLTHELGCPTIRSVWGIGYRLEA